MLGVATWLLAPLVLPSKLPADYPQLPDLRKVNPQMRGAIENADRQAKRQPQSAEALGKLAMTYHANLFLDQAARAYRIAARLAPENDRWVYCQAVLEEERGNEKEQFGLLEQTLRLNPGRAPALLKMGDALFKQERLDEAAHDYESAAHSPAASVQAAFGLGRVAARRGDWKAVIGYVTPLARDYPRLEPPFELLEEAYRALGKAQQAEEARRSMAASQWKIVPPPEDPVNEELMSVCYSSTRLLKQAGLLSHLGYADRALQVGRRAAEAEPKDPDVRFFLAHTLVIAKSDQPEAVEEALTQLTVCLRLRPQDPAPLWMFAQDFFETPKTPSAVERMRGLVRPYAGRSEAHFYLGLLADARGDSGEAISEFQAALRNDPNNAGVYNKLGVALDKAGRLDEAIGSFQKSVELNSMNPMARFNLGAARLQRGNDAAGLRDLAEVLRLKPDYAPAHFCMGFACLYSRKHNEAIAHFREGLHYMPNDPEAHFGIASALSAQRNRADALGEVREALRLRPGYPEALQLLQQLER